MTTDLERAFANLRQAIWELEAATSQALTDLLKRVERLEWERNEAEEEGVYSDV